MNFQKFHYKTRKTLKIKFHGFETLFPAGKARNILGLMRLDVTLMLPSQHPKMCPIKIN